jgi:hypothetical protein
MDSASTSPTPRLYIASNSNDRTRLRSFSLVLNAGCSKVIWATSRKWVLWKLALLNRAAVNFPRSPHAETESLHGLAFAENAIVE